MKEKDWWKKTFGKRYYNAWKSVYSDARAREEVKFVLGTIKLKRGCLLLDIPCGQGRHSIEFARHNIRVTGLDYSSALLKIAKDRVKKENLPVRFRKGDMRNFSSSKKFDAVVVLGNSFGYFSDTENERVIMNISRVTKKGGKVVLDLANTLGLLKYGNKGQEIKIPNGNIVVRETFFDPLRLTSGLDWNITLERKTFTFQGQLRLYTFTEINHLLKNTTFQ